DLDGHGDWDGKREEGAPLTQASREREQQQNDGSEEDDVAEGGVEAEAVVECLLADQLLLVWALLVAELVSRIEGAIGRAGDLRDDGNEEERDPVPVDRPQRLHERDSRKRLGRCLGLRQCEQPEPQPWPVSAGASPSST